MQKLVVTQLENIRRVQLVKYEVIVPISIKNPLKYIKNQCSNGTLVLGKVLSETTLDAELLEEEFFSVKRVKIGRKIKTRWGKKRKFE